MIASHNCGSSHGGRSMRRIIDGGALRMEHGCERRYDGEDGDIEGREEET